MLWKNKILQYYDYGLTHSTLLHNQVPWGHASYSYQEDYKYSLLMHCIKIKSPAKFLLNEQYVFVGGNIYFLCVLSCSSEEA